MYVVVGRGIIGLTVALRMAQAGLPVTLVGPKNLFGTASYAALGVATNKGLLWPRDPLFRAKFEGHRRLWHLMDELESQYGATVARFRGNIYEPYVSPEHFRAIKSRTFARLHTGAFAIQLQDQLSSAEAFAEAQGRFHYPLDYWFEPRSLLGALESALQRIGVRSYEQPLEHLEVAPSGGLRLQLKDDTKVHAKDCVLALGAWLKPFFEEHFSLSLPIEARPGGYWEAKAPTSAIGPDQVILAGTNKVVMTGGRLLIGATDRSGSFDPGTWFLEEREHRRLIPQFVRKLSPLYPQAFEALDAKCPFLFGVRARGRGQRPIVGPWFFSRGESVHVAGAMGKSGFLLACEIAESFVRRFRHPGADAELAKIPLLEWARAPA